jgi:ABC-type bacteriocin/lantibiotic exporter with double-glycine peptidase domain
LTLRNTVNLSWQLLDRAEKRRLVVAMIFQSFLNILDLVGVLALSLTTYLLTNDKFPDFQFFRIFRNEDLNRIAFTCVAITIFLFTAKGFVTPVLYSRIMRFLTGTSVKISIKISKDFFSRPLTFLQRRNAQDTAYALSQGVTSAINEILGSLIILVSEMLLLSSLFAVMLFSNWILFVLNILVFGVSLSLLHKIVGDRQFKNTNKRINSILLGNSQIMNMISAYRELVVSRKMDYFLHEFKGTRILESDSASQGQVLNVIPKYVFEVSFYLGAGGILLFLYNFSDPEYAFTLFVLFIASGSRILPSILRIQAALSNIKSNEALSTRTFSLIQDLAKPENKDPRAGIRPHSLESNNLLEIEGLEFEYEGNPEWKLKISKLTVKRGLKIALVGPSGSGKSTLTDLLLGVIRPSVGEIRFPGSSNSLPSNACVAYMPQKITIFNRSIRENIALGVLPSEIDDFLVRECVAKSGLVDLLESLPAGYDEILREDGSNLSGGQKQRLGFARVLYRSPDILILDEATSSLDSDSEFQISESIDSLGANLSVISIAHRLNTIKNFDLILYMENGGIEAMGTFDEVRSMSAAFNSQASRMGL